MSEYIIEWSGIGARIAELIGSVPACLIPKRLREERLREEIVRCRHCEHIIWTDNPMTSTHYWCIEYDRPCGLDDFCSWAERRKSGGIESIYDWKWVREMVGEEEAERRKEQQREEESE